MENEKNELMVREQNHVNYIESKKDVIVKMLGLENATPQDLDVAFTQFKRTGLDPVTRQIYAIVNNGKLSIMASIDGFRLIAERTGAYEGQTAPQWCGDDGKWVDVWLKKEPPRAARIGVYKTKFREPLYAIALFDEYAGRYAYDDKYGKFKKGDLTFMWAKMPALMISKVAEALALRKGFPNETSGIYSTEEMEQSNEPKEVNTSMNTHAAIEGHNTEKITEQKQSGQIDFANYTINFGKSMRGKKLSDISIEEHRSALTWISEHPESKTLKDGKPNRNTLDYEEMATAYIIHMAKNAPPKVDENELFPE